MALKDGVCIGFGHAPARDAIFKIQSWPFANQHEKQQQRDFLIEANAGDRLILHIELQNFQWNGADTLMVVISESVCENPVYVILGKNEASHCHVTVSGYQSFTDRAMNTYVQFEFATLTVSRIKPIWVYTNGPTAK